MATDKKPEAVKIREEIEKYAYMQALAGHSNDEIIQAVKNSRKTRKVLGNESVADAINKGYFRAQEQKAASTRGEYIILKLSAKYDDERAPREGGGLNIQVDCDFIDDKGDAHKISVFRYGPVTTPTDVALPPLSGKEKYRLIASHGGKGFPRELTSASMKPGTKPKKIVFKINSPTSGAISKPSKTSGKATVPLPMIPVLSGAAATPTPSGALPTPPRSPGGAGRGPGSLHGYVTDAVTKKPIVGCDVSLAEITRRSVQTGSNGHYKIDNIAYNTYTLKVEDARYFPPMDPVIVTVSPSYRGGVGTARQDVALVAKFAAFHDILGNKHGIGRTATIGVTDLLFKEWEEVEAHARERGISEEDIKDLKRKKDNIHKDYNKYGEKLKEIDKHLPKIRFPEIAKKGLFETGRIMGGLATAIGGLMLVSILGIQSWQLYTGFLCLAFHVVMPGGPDVFLGVSKHIRRIRDDYENQITTALNADPPGFEEAEHLANTMNAEIEAEKSLGEWEGFKKAAKAGSGVAAMKQLSKIAGVGFLLLGIGSSGLPMAALVALAAGFIAYFSFTTSRSLSEEKPTS